MMLLLSNCDTKSHAFYFCFAAPKNMQTKACELNALGLRRIQTLQRAPRQRLIHFNDKFSTKLTSTKRIDTDTDFNDCSKQRNALQRKITSTTAHPSPAHSTTTHYVMADCKWEREAVGRPAKPSVVPPEAAGLLRGRQVETAWQAKGLPYCE